MVSFSHCALPHGSHSLRITDRSDGRSRCICRTDRHWVGRRTRKCVVAPDVDRLPKDWGCFTCTDEVWKKRDDCTCALSTGIRVAARCPHRPSLCSASLASDATARYRHASQIRHERDYMRVVPGRAVDHPADRRLGRLSPLLVVVLYQATCSYSGCETYPCHRKTHSGLTEMTTQLETRPLRLGFR